ncbi:MAG: hypothetical protein HY518_03455 [Candidatus Aenigmarchaeota archaeon]|nr:hypothetical protein [Candidatus Aenigmarchaeota archaeon]
MLVRAGERLDLFKRNVIHFIFSESMERRAERIYEFGGTLTLKIVDPHDLILMKCATEREKDRDDIRSIIESSKIEWDLIIDEMRNQLRLGARKIDVFGFLDTLDHLKRQMKVKIPGDLHKRCWSLLKTAESSKKTNSQPKSKLKKKNK